MNQYRAKRADSSLNGVFNQILFIKAPKDATIEDVNNPLFLADLATGLNVGDRLFIRAFDNSYHAELVILAKDGSAVFTRVLSYADVCALKAKAVAEVTQKTDDEAEVKFENSHFDIEYSDIKKCYRIIEKATGDLVKDDIETERKARNQLAKLLEQKDN